MALSKLATPTPVKSTFILEINTQNMNLEMQTPTNPTPSLSTSLLQKITSKVVNWL